MEQTANDALRTARRLATLFEQDVKRVQDTGRGGVSALTVLSALRQRPLRSLKQICSDTGTNQPVRRYPARRGHGNSAVQQRCRQETWGWRMPLVIMLLCCQDTANDENSARDCSNMEKSVVPSSIGFKKSLTLNLDQYLASHYSDG